MMAQVKGAAAKMNPSRLDINARTARTVGQLYSEAKANHPKQRKSLI